MKSKEAQCPEHHRHHGLLHTCSRSSVSINSVVCCCGAQVSLFCFICISHFFFHYNISQYFYICLLFSKFLTSLHLQHHHLLLFFFSSCITSLHSRSSLHYTIQILLLLFKLYFFFLFSLTAYALLPV